MKLDLKELLAKITGQAEFKTLLWRNTQGAQSSYSFSANFSDYDEIEVQFERAGCIHSMRMATSGSANFVFPYEGYFVVRTATISSGTMTFANGAYYMSYNSGTLGYGSSYAQPYKVYGIRYVGGVVRKLLKALKPLTLGRGWAV